MKLHGLLFAAALAAAPFQAVDAAQASPAAMMDCSNANTMMTNMSMPMAMSSPAAMSGSGTPSMDKMYVMQMHDMAMHGMQMAKLEAACGKDPKTRTMAAKMTQDLQDYATRLQMMLEQQPG